MQQIGLKEKIRERPKLKHNLVFYSAHRDFGNVYGDTSSDFSLSIVNIPTINARIKNGYVVNPNASRFDLTKINFIKLTHFYIPNILSETSSIDVPYLLLGISIYGNKTLGSITGNDLYGVLQFDGDKTKEQSYLTEKFPLTDDEWKLNFSTINLNSVSMNKVRFTMYTPNGNIVDFGKDNFKINSTVDHSYNNIQGTKTIVFTVTEDITGILETGDKVLFANTVVRKTYTGPREDDIFYPTDNNENIVNSREFIVDVIDSEISVTFQEPVGYAVGSSIANGITSFDNGYIVLLKYQTMFQLSYQE